MTKAHYIDQATLDDIPEPAKSRLQKTYEETQAIYDSAAALLETQLPHTVQFEYRMEAPLPELTHFERAQCTCFVTRYEHLPTLNRLDFVEHKGKVYLRNISFIRHILNEYRSIISNQSDSVYFSKIHSFCHKKLANRDSSKGLIVTVQDESEDDVTDVLLKAMGENNKAIKLILSKCEYGYIYNDILQHSDHDFTRRLLADYHSGNLNHLFIKHAYLLRQIKELMWWYHYTMNNLVFPKLGPI